MANKAIYVDKQGNFVTLAQLLKDKSIEEIKAIKFLNHIPIKEGCLRKEYLSKADFSKIVQAKLVNIKSKERALLKIGIDGDQVKEIDPICFEGSRLDNTKLSPYVTLYDNMYFSSMYELTWLFFGDDQIFIHKCAFDITDQTLVDTTSEFFYKDITAFVTSHDTIPKKIKVEVPGGCSQKYEFKTIDFKTNYFKIKVPGEEFDCALGSNNEDHANIISAMKQKLREKKNR